MSTGDLWLTLYPGKILGMQAWDTYFKSAVRNAINTSAQDIWGDGGVLGSAPTWTVSGAGNDELTLTADRIAYTPDGYRVELDSALDVYQDQPWEADPARNYSVGVRHEEVPVAAELGTDGIPHFSHFVEVVGVQSVVAGSVAVGGGQTVFTLTLPASWQWTASAEAKTVVVWYENGSGDPETASSECVATGSMVLDGGQYKVTIPHNFGQSTPSTTPGDYQICFIGPAIYRSTALPPDWSTTYTLVAVLTAGAPHTVDTSTVPEIESIGDYIADFLVEHAAGTGLHTEVHADRVDVGAPTTGTSADGEVAVELLRADLIETKPAADGPLVDGVVVKQADGTDKVSLMPGDPTMTGGGGALFFNNAGQSLDNTCNIWASRAGATWLSVSNISAGQYLGLEIDSIIRRSDAADKTGLAFAIQCDNAVNETLQFSNVGAGALDLELVDGDLTVTAGQIDGNPDAYLGAIVGTAGISLLSATITALGDATVNSVDAYQGYICDPRNTSGGYGYENPVRFAHSITPIAGGWMQTDDPSSVYLVHAGGTPPRVESSSTTAITIKRDLDSIFWGTGAVDTGVANNVQINNVTFRYIETNSGVLTGYLRKAKRDGTGATVTVQTWSPGASAVMVTSSNDFTEVVDPLYYYWIAFTLAPDGAGASTDVALADVIVNYQKSGVE